MSPSSEPTPKKARIEDGEDRLSALPEDTLLTMLSFLTSRDSVRTSTLSHRWRHLWKSVPALRVMDSQKYNSANHVNKFVNNFLILREERPLHVVEIKSYETADVDEAFRYIKVWVQHALGNDARDLRVCILSEDMFEEEEDSMVHWTLPSGLIKSVKLTKLELIRVDCYEDFSSLPALKYLKLEFSTLFTDSISSTSLTHLCFMYCDFYTHVRARIAVPSLRYLELVDCKGRTPLLDRMPLLISAFVRLRDCSDYCHMSYELGGCKNVACVGCNSPDGSNIKNCPVLLEGLSDATNLELTAERTMFVFRKDLTRGPVFGKLKRLLLNDWCITTNLHPLISFLQRSPALEELILQLPNEIPDEMVESQVSYGVKNQLIASKHLSVDIKCYKEDGLIRKILDVLNFHGVPCERIKILQPPKQIKARSGDPCPSTSLSFEQDRS